MNELEEIDCSSLVILKPSSASESSSEGNSQLSSDDKGKDKIYCEIATTDVLNRNKEIVKTKTQISDECVSYEDYLKDSSKRLVHMVCVYPKVSYFKNSIFVKLGGSLLVDNDLVKLVKEYNFTVTKEGFFLSSKIIGNNLNEHMEVKVNVMSNEQYDSKWYTDSGCSKHMTGKKEYLRDYRTFDDTGNHNLVSISQLVVGTANAVTFNNQRSIITKEATKEVLLKLERKGSMFPVNLKPITGGPSLCLLSKENSDISWLWHRRLAHLNFKDINKLVVMDLVLGMLALKFDNDSLCSSCEHGMQTKQKHRTMINLKITKLLSLLYMDLCGPSAVESIGKKRYILVIVEDYSRFTWYYS
ncbi:hypothetical protein L2E82_48889 [Cichorium intybus]|uniref:Uncharacterized protein n=1 Tax=Cichorium intybus TaxID=13427 RepID=A0ACB8Z345_CICIN|nr:hypothetical protein L2E82_48889 [Cichorium intybus]